MEERGGGVFGGRGAGTRDLWALRLGWNAPDVSLPPCVLGERQWRYVAGIWRPVMDEEAEESSQG